MIALGFVLTGIGQTTSFTYQGDLRFSGQPANGNFDFEFALFDAADAGNQLGTTQAVGNLAVTNGRFTVTLDFGSQFPGANRFLEIRVRQAGQPGITILSPRQQLSSTPYAVKSLAAETAQTAATATNATNADNATNAVNATNALNATNATNATTAATATNALSLGGVAANQYVLTGDARLSDARQPTAGSPNYIWNSNTPQTGSNFNISGTGTANVLNANVQFNINGIRAFSTPSEDNVFAGKLAGFNTSGVGLRNSFLGWSAGANNTSGDDNTFLGWNAGSTNTTGSNNSLLGSGTSLGSNNLSFATAIGAGSTVSRNFAVVLGRTSDTVEVPGNVEVGGAGIFGLGEYNASFSRITGYGPNDAQIIGQSASGTKSSPLPITAGDRLFQISGRGWDGNGFGTFGSNIRWVATEDWTPTARGSQIEFNLVVPGTTNSFQRAMTVTDTGVGIRTTNPITEPLEIVDNGAKIIFGGAGCPTGSVAIGLNGAFGNCLNYTLRGTASDVYLNRPTGGAIVVREGNGSTQFAINAGGTVDIRVLGITGGTALCRNADQEIAFCSSSLRYKKNVAPFAPGMSFVRQLRPIAYEWKTDGNKDVGFGAEEVAKIDPRFVTYNDKGEVEGVKYDRIGVVLVNALKEQQIQIDKLDEQISSQKAMIEKQQTEIGLLKVIVCSMKDLASSPICKSNP